VLLPPEARPNRRKWLLPLILALVALIVLLLLLSRCGDSDKSKHSSAAASTGTVSPADTATTAAGSSVPASDPGQTGGSSTAEGAVTANGYDRLSTQTSISQGGHDGEQAVGHAVKVQSVPADEGFWVGTSATDRLWVQLSGTHGESDYKVKQGNAIDFTGTVKAAGKNFATSVGLTASEGAGQLTQQGHYVSAPSISVKLFQ
jgi:hypothetical protein